MQEITSTYLYKYIIHTSTEFRKADFGKANVQSVFQHPYEIIRNDLQDLLPITEALSIKIWLN